ncbi:MAG: T9SS type A sorting domain-containing protein [Chitinophagales bacterium]
MSLISFSGPLISYMTAGSVNAISLSYGGSGDLIYNFRNGATNTPANRYEGYASIKHSVDPLPNVYITSIDYSVISSTGTVVSSGSVVFPPATPTPSAAYLAMMTQLRTSGIQLGTGRVVIAGQSTLRVIEHYILDNDCNNTPAIDTRVFLLLGANQSPGSTNNASPVGNTNGPSATGIKSEVSKTQNNNKARIYRLTPNNPSGVPTTFPWENACHGGDNTTEQHWAFLVEMPRNAGTTNNGKITIDNPANNWHTLIRRGSVTVNGSNASGYGISPTTTATGISTTIDTIPTSKIVPPNPYTLANGFSAADVPAGKITVDFSSMKSGDRILIEFDTYRACAGNFNPPGSPLNPIGDIQDGVYYNHWQITGQYFTPCSLTTPISMTTAPLFTAGVTLDPPLISPALGSIGYLTTNSIAGGGGGISLNRPGALPPFTSADLTMRQDFNPYTTELFAPTGGCAEAPAYSPYSFYIRNMIALNSTTDDFDGMLFPSTGIAGGAGISGGAPGEVGTLIGDMEIVLDFDFDNGNIKIDDVALPSIVSGARVWTALSSNISHFVGTPSVPPRPTYPTVVMNSLSNKITRIKFVLDNLTRATLGISTTKDLKEFLYGSYFTFGFVPCCSSVNMNPLVRITTSIIPNPGTCSSCAIPLSQVSSQFHMHCPGCNIPGMYLHSSDLSRTNLGLVDADNNRLPDSREVIDLNAPSYAPYRNMVESRTSIVYDHLTARLWGTLEGGAADGFTITDLNNAIGAGNRTFTDFYLEQLIPNGDIAGIEFDAAAGATIQYGTDPPISGIVPTMYTSGSNRIFVYNLQGTSGGVDNFPAQLAAGAKFTVVSHYTVTKNPSAMTTMSTTDKMYMSLGHYPTSTQSPATQYQGIHDVIAVSNACTTCTSAVQRLNAVLNATRIGGAGPSYGIYFCTGGGTTHRVFPVKTYAITKYSFNNSCQKTINVAVSSQIGAQMTMPGSSIPTVDYNDVFPYEYRTVPSIPFSTGSFGALSTGPVLVTGEPLKFTVKPILGFNIQPASMKTVALYKKTPMQLLNLNTELNVASMLRHPTGAPNDWMLDFTQANFIPPYTAASPLITTSPASLTSITTSNNLINATDNASGLPAFFIGDETFYQDVTFNVTPDCDHYAGPQSVPIGNTYLLGNEEAYSTIPSDFGTNPNTITTDRTLGRLNNALLPSYINTTFFEPWVPTSIAAPENAVSSVPSSISSFNPLNMVSPYPALVGGGYPHISGNTIDNLFVFEASGYIADGTVNTPAMPKNLFFYMEIPAIPASPFTAAPILLDYLGHTVTLESFKVECPAGSNDLKTIVPTYFSIGTHHYVGYKIDPAYFFSASKPSFYTITGTTGTPAKTVGYYHVVLGYNDCYFATTSTLPRTVTFDPHIIWTCNDDNPLVSLPGATYHTYGTWANATGSDLCMQTAQYYDPAHLPEVGFVDAGGNSAFSLAPTSMSCGGNNFQVDLSATTYGGIGRITPKITIPAGFTLSNVKMQIGSGTIYNLAIPSPTGTSYSFTSIVGGSATSIADLTDFTTTSVVGVNGFTNASPVIHLSFSLTPVCSVPPASGYVVQVAWNAVKYCNLSDVISPICTASTNPIVGADCSGTTAVASPDNICSGGTSTLTATGGSSYTWSAYSVPSGATAGMSTISGAAIAVSPTNTTTADLTVTYQVNIVSGTCTIPRMVAVIVHPTANVNAGLPLSPICANSTATVPLGGSFSGAATGAVWTAVPAVGTFANNSGATPALTTYTPPAGFTGTIDLWLTCLPAGISCGVTSITKSLQVIAASTATPSISISMNQPNAPAPIHLPAGGATPPIQPSLEHWVGVNYFSQYNNPTIAPITTPTPANAATGGFYQTSGVDHEAGNYPPGMSTYLDQGHTNYCTLTGVDFQSIATNADNPVGSGWQQVWQITNNNAANSTYHNIGYTACPGTGQQWGSNALPEGIYHVRCHLYPTCNTTNMVTSNELEFRISRPWDPSPTIDVSVDANCHINIDATHDIPNDASFTHYKWGILLNSGTSVNFSASGSTNTNFALPAPYVWSDVSAVICTVTVLNNSRTVCITPGSRTFSMTVTPGSPCITLSPPAFLYKQTPANEVEALVQTSLNTLLIKPNPATSNVEFTYTFAEQPANGNISIYNVLGQLVKTIALTETAGNKDVNIEDLAPGNYTVTLNNKQQKVSVKRLVKE